MTAQATSVTEADRVARLNAGLRHAPPADILRAALGQEFAGDIAVVSSFGAEAGALLALVADIAPATPVLFLDTGMHFFQTLDYRDALTARLGLTDVRMLHPAPADLAGEDPRNVLWQTDVDACCDLRKTRPLDRALEGFGAWITGRKRFQGGARVSLPVVEHEAGRFKVNPLANATPEEIAEILARHDVPPHPLVAEGYPSIGCWPCTRPVEAGGDARSGRWAGSDKTECGIHLGRGD
jgi:phosphoadenosine phosphosulfate reductase